MRSPAPLTPGARVWSFWGGTGARPGAPRRPRAPRRGDRFLAQDAQGASPVWARAHQGDARRLPVATGCVDGVWAKASLLHLQRDDVARALTEVRRILRPGGILFVSRERAAARDDGDGTLRLPRASSNTGPMRTSTRSDGRSRLRRADAHDGRRDPRHLADATHAPSLIGRRVSGTSRRGSSREDAGRARLDQACR
jgi:SAM-dependent methyltransferase